MTREELEKVAQRMVESVRVFVSAAEARVMQHLNTALSAVQLKAGPQGERGEPGPQGASGQNGVAGEPGPRGEAGVVGLSGKDGAAGPQGEPGPQGERGEPGPQGERGEAGATGADGVPGPRGEAGLPGTIGPQGERGADGAAGPQGERGADGAAGPQGSAGPQGERGEAGVEGVPGPRGEIGPIGPQGTAGESGRDAAELNILPSIDEKRSYRRGTWASHNGGLIRARRDTDSLDILTLDLSAAGWEVMVDGVAALVIEQGEDPRVFNVFSQLTSGKLVKNSLRIPVIMYKEVWREGTYMQGDVVTWGGSAWHSQVDKNTDKPGTSDKWKLMVKEGARGKDGSESPAKGHAIVRVR